MTVNGQEAEKIDVSLSQNLVDSKKGRIRVWRCEGLDFFLIKNGIPLGETSIIQIPWAMAVERNGVLIYSVQIEREDLRLLSSLTGEMLRSLQSDYGIKGFLTKETVSMYGEGIHESLGEYPGKLDESSAVEYLLDAALDSLDCIEEAVEA